MGKERKFPVENRLSSLKGRKLGEFLIKLQNVKSGRFPNEIMFELYLKNGQHLSHTPLIRGTLFLGKGYYSPWLEFKYQKKVHLGPNPVDVQEKQLDVSLFEYLSQLLPPGSHMMVGYSNHKTTHKALLRGFPPSTTYIGFLLWKAGCTWFKDWYFPEGGKEGGFKLQGNRAPHKKGRQRQMLKIKRELRSFLKEENRRSDIRENAKKRANIILKEIKKELRL